MNTEFGNKFTRVIRGGVELTPVENSIIKTCIQSLPRDLGSIIVKQLEQYNLAQREADWRAINFYCVTGIRRIKNVTPLLPFKSDDAVIAKFKLETGSGKIINVVLHAVDGRFFSINFSESVKSLQNESRIKIRNVTKSWLSQIKPNV